MSVTVETSKNKMNTYSYDRTLLEQKCNSLYNILVKRIIGFFIALFLLICLSPVLLVLSIAIVIDSGFPVFYKAERGGYKNKIFKIYKFRTMIKNADKIGGGTTALNDSRITKIGGFLRKTKMDEIPQLFNIIKGEMSFVGPRPELIKYTSQYRGIEEYILRVRPGITDYSSVEFINLDEIVGSENADETYENCVLKRKNSLRVQYVGKVSFMVDLTLFFMTILKTLKKSGSVLLTWGDKNGTAYSKKY